MATKEQAYNGGYDCIKNGANTENCHYTLFATKELLKEWERGRDKALTEDNKNG